MKKLLYILLLFSTLSYGQKLKVGRSIGLKINTTDTVAYGYHGLWTFAGRPLSTPEVLDSLKTLPHFGLFRYPGGPNSGTWNWQTGTDDSVSGEATPLTDLKILIDSVDCDVVFVLNMMTRPLSDQLAMLHYADSIGIPVKYLELGNEVNVLGSQGHQVFPTCLAYADTCAVWMAGIYPVYPNVLIGVVGENKGWSKRWNDTVVAINPDAIITHLGPQAADFVTDSVADFAELETALTAQWNSSGVASVNKPLWVTEANYNFDINYQMNQANEIATTLYVMQRVSQLIMTGVNGLKMICVRGIEGPNEGAFEVGNSFITRGSTAFAMALF